jgi:hypothetical protein
MENNKKILIIGAVVILSGLTFYFVTKKKGGEETPSLDNTSNNTSNTPPDTASDNSSNNSSNNTSNLPPVSASQSDDMRKRIVIKSAIFGESNNNLDIKKTVEDLIKLGMYEFRATNNFFGKDPSYKKVKYVMIDYSIDGVKVPLAVFNSETSGFRADIDGVREGNLVTLFKKK